MSNYTKTTNFLAKDSLPEEDSGKIIKGSEFDTEFNALQVAINTKADLASPALTGVPTAPTATAGTNTTQLSTTAFVTTALATLYPIGSIYSSTSSTNPNSLFGFGTWVAYGAGRVLIGVGSGFTAAATGGSADAVVVSHTHTLTDPGHNHTTSVGNQGSQNGSVSGGGTMPTTAGATLTTTTASTGITMATAGVSGTNANLPPYVVVYMWNRTA
jgi:hypothetical protein